MRKKLCLEGDDEGLNRFQLDLHTKTERAPFRAASLLPLAICLLLASPVSC